ncbi:glycosyltransferase family 4 protein [Paenibacillus hodogayensis]|uniref:Glycosyltransferase family 4 protein n=1 Tax=Paenibacillus hodogayensis TaxID=279208 RepID=A0ABV5VTD1_9BACL
MSRMRLAIVTPGTFPVPSGRSSSVEQVAMQVGEKLKRQAEVTVFGKKTRSLPARELLDGIRHIRPPVKPYIRQVARVLKREVPDIVQCENRPRHARLLKRLFPEKPVVLSLHSTTFLSRPHISAPELRGCLQAADAIVVNSQFLKERVAASDASVAAKIVVNHLGVDTERFVSRWTEEEERKRQAQLNALGLAGKKIILYVGRFIPIKGVHQLLAVLPTITAFEPEAVLLLVGGAYYGSNRMTPYVRRLRRMARDAKPHVRFIPFIPHEQMPSWFRLADTVVVPSTGEEAFGLVNVEAMACGVPVVASASGGMKEIIQHGSTGLLAEPGALAEQLVRHVCALLGDRDYARSLGENGMQRVHDHFTWQHTADRLYALYDRLRANGGMP